MTVSIGVFIYTVEPFVINKFVLLMLLATHLIFVMMRPIESIPKVYFIQIVLRM